MATIDYKEKYEQALERARQFSEKPYLEDSAGIVGYIFPELKESEDEKIRKALLEMVHDTTGDELWVDYDVHKEEALAWLEKQGEITKEWSEMKINNIQTELQEMVDLKQKTEQGEQKSAWSEEDETALGDALWCCKQAASIAKNENDMGNVWYAETWLKSLKDRVQPKQEWSEEDENRVNRLIAYFEDKESFTAEDDIVYANWLKSLRPQSRWNPSDEQIEALHDAIIYVKDSMFPSKNVLKKLYGQLKKLREA